MLSAGGQEITQSCLKREAQGTPPFDADLSSESRPTVGHAFIHSNKVFAILSVCLSMVTITLLIKFLFSKLYLTDFFFRIR